jgi:hypothetical protein
VDWIVLSAKFMKKQFASKIQRDPEEMEEDHDAKK